MIVKISAIQTGAENQTGIQFSPRRFVSIRACSDRTSSNGFKLKEGRCGCQEEVLHCESDETLEQVSFQSIL